MSPAAKKDKSGLSENSLFAAPRKPTSYSLQQINGKLLKTDIFTNLSGNCYKFLLKLFLSRIDIETGEEKTRFTKNFCSKLEFVSCAVWLY